MRWFGSSRRVYRDGTDRGHHAEGQDRQRVRLGDQRIRVEGGAETKRYHDGGVFGEAGGKGRSAGCGKRPNRREQHALAQSFGPAEKLGESNKDHFDQAGDFIRWSTPSTVLMRPLPADLLFEAVDHQRYNVTGGQKPPSSEDDEKDNACGDETRKKRRVATQSVVKRRESTTSIGVQGEPATSSRERKRGTSAGSRGGEPIVLLAGQAASRLAYSAHWVHSGQPGRSGHLVHSGQPVQLVRWTP